MVTQQRNTPVQSPQDFIRIQDLFYLCLGKWHWFVVSLAVCLGIAVWYLLTTPPVYTRSASILIKDDSKGKSASTDMETFSDFGLFTSNTNVNNEMGTLQSPDLMREVVSRLHLDMDYKVSGRFHRAGANLQPRAEHANRALPRGRKVVHQKQRHNGCSFAKILH